MRGSQITSLSLTALSFILGTDAFVFRGVNLGGWLVTEPWMTPSIFNATATKDEWSLCAALGKDQCLKTLSNHWSTFYTRDDFVAIQKAGLNAVRIPFGYWAVDVLSYEPFVAGAYPYLIQAVQWAGQLGLKVFIDMHGLPGSQNGWEESGREGSPLFFANQSNTDRTMKVLQNLTTEFMKSEYLGAVTNIELMNEPTYGYAQLLPFYTAGANVVGAGNSSGINTTISDAFFNPHTWERYDPWNSAAQQPAKFITLDTHQFWAFPPLDKLNQTEVLAAICGFAKSQLRVSPDLGTLPTIVGEWSLSTGVTANSNSNSYDDTDKRTWFRKLFEAQNAAFTPHAAGQASIGWFFWAWKTEYDIDAWSYRKGLDQKYIPSNISDPSTYIFPLGDDGCIIAFDNYTAPTLPNQGAAVSTPVTTSTTAGTSSTASSDATSSTPSKTSFATRSSVSSLHSLTAIIFAVLLSIAL